VSVLVGFSVASAATVPSTNLSTYVLFGINTLQFKDFAFTNVGNVGVNDANGVLSWGKQSFFDNNTEVVTDILGRAGDRSSLWDLFANTIGNLPASVMIRDAGPMSWAPLPLITPLPPTPSCTPTTTAETVAKNGTLTLGPGSYGALKVQNGGVLTLTGGTYCFASIKAGRKVTINVQAPSQITAMGNVVINPSSKLVPNGLGVGASDIHVNAAGKLVNLSHRTKIFGVFYAPNALLRFGHAGSFTGQFVAKNLRSDFDDTFTLESCGNGIVDPGEDCDAGEDGGPCCTATCDFRAAGTPCDDNTVCNGHETCSAFGQCVPGTPLNCNDNNLCTDDGCDPTTGCTHTNNTAPCDDHNACTAGDHCANGACQSGAPVSCNDGNACTTDTCNPLSGCHNTGIAGCCTTNAQCADTNLCTINERCVNNTCVSDPVNCNDNNQCTSDTCVPAVGCVHTALVGAPCNDNNACTINDACTDSACGGFPLGCDDGNPCTVDGCDPTSGCTHTSIPGCCLTDSQCDDGNVCNGTETCTNNTCVHGTPLNCNDNNTCTDDGCDPSGGCTHTDNTDPCEEGNLCTSGDHCMNGICIPGPTIGCNDNNPCTTDTCDPQTGCHNTGIPGCCTSDAQCADTNLCTINERCVNNTCVSDPVNCDDNNACTADSCIPSVGCVHVNTGLACDDNNACTINDVCTDSACGGFPINCDDGDLCTADSCDPASGCVHTPIPNCGGQTGNAFCTLTQGAYGASNGAANGPQGSVTNNPSILPASIGAPGTGLSVTVNTQASLIAFLPANGTPNVLCGNPMPVACPGDLVINGAGDVPDPGNGGSSGGDGAGTLAGQALAMTLNVALSNLGANPPGLGDFQLPATFCTCDANGGRETFTIPQCILDNAVTVNNLLLLADQALRGVPLLQLDADAPSCLTYSTIETALDQLNLGFDNCRTLCSCQ
jgi:hypothetical protein